MKSYGHPLSLKCSCSTCTEFFTRVDELRESATWYKCATSLLEMAHDLDEYCQCPPCMGFRYTRVMLQRQHKADK